MAAAPTLETAPAPTRPRHPVGAEGRPALRVVGRVRHTRRWALVLAAAAAAGIFGVVALAALAAESAVAARALETEVTTLAQRHDELTAEVAALASPQRVQQVATTRLGMVRAAKPAFLVVAPNRPPATAVAVTGTPADAPTAHALGE